MALDTYTNLQTAILSLLNRTDLATSVPDWITLAEGQMHRRFIGNYRKGLPYPRRILQRSDAALSTSDEYIAVPDDFAAAIDFTLISADPDIVLDYLAPSNFEQWKTSTVMSGLAPKYYTIKGGEFQIFPVADQSYTVELVYQLRFPALSGSNATNWILTDYPDAYLYGAAVQAIPFLKMEADRAQFFVQAFATAIDDICAADPEPADMTTLRTEFPQISRWGFRGRYDINTDAP